VPEAVTPAEPNPKAILTELGCESVDEPTRVTGGQDAAIWRVILENGSAYALRVVSATREVGFKRELAVMKVAAAGGARVPAVKASGKVDGYLAMLMEWCDGRPMLQAVSSRPWKLWSYARTLGHEQARLQKIPINEELKEGSPEYWLRRSGLEEPITRALLERGVRSDALVHMDFHPLNVLVDGQDRLTGIIDWTGAAAGDPRADFAMTASILSVAPVPPGPLRPILRRFRSLLYGAWRGAYERSAGRVDDDEVAPFLAWAGAVMLREMEPRAREGRKWPTLEDLEPIRKWKRDWSRRAGLEP
jgi:aminoglycoside phosphotransferase (APT) family kinase protein